MAPVAANANSLMGRLNFSGQGHITDTARA
jgi:hypothetical protein